MEWHPIAPPRAALPPVSAFLRETLSLGVRSIRPALPAIVFLCFYQFGMSLYLEFGVRQTTPFGEPDQRAQLVYLMMAASAFLPLFVLVQLPFLPLQDALRRGERIGFLDAIRRVLERFPALTGSGVIQILVIGIPSVLFVGIGALFIKGAGSVSQAAAAAAAMLVLFPVMVWFAIAIFYFMFSTPAVILDEVGPVASIRLSVSLVWRHFWELFGRLFVWWIVAILASVIATFPATLLQVGAAVSGAEPPAAKVARVFWTAVVTALLLPFWVSALLVLYRAFAPGAAATAPAAAAPAAPPAHPPTRPAPDNPSPEGNPQIFE